MEVFSNAARLVWSSKAAASFSVHSNRNKLRTPTAWLRRAQGRERKMDLRELEETYGNVASGCYKGWCFAVTFDDPMTRLNLEIWGGRDRSTLYHVVTFTLFADGSINMPVSSEGHSKKALSKLWLLNELFNSALWGDVLSLLHITKGQNEKILNCRSKFLKLITFKHNRRKLIDAINKDPKLAQALIDVVEALGSNKIKI